MTKEEAKKYLEWFERTWEEENYIAYSLYRQPFCIRHPGAFEKRERAKIVLGLSQWQRTFEQLLKTYPSLTREHYDKKREKWGIK